jgi:hypothetical protein
MSSEHIESEIVPLLRNAGRELSQRLGFES